jgi:adenosylcobyric acid synthase
VESGHGRTEGLGFLDVTTRLEAGKSTFNVEAEALAGLFGSALQEAGGPLCGGLLIKGFEIHAGSSTAPERPLFRIRKRNGRDVDILDGAISADSAVIGTYLHGLFHNDGLRSALVHELCQRAGAEPATDGAMNYEAALEGRIDALAATVRGALDMEMLLEILGISWRSGLGPDVEPESWGKADGSTRAKSSGGSDLASPPKGSAARVRRQGT